MSPIMISGACFLLALLLILPGLHQKLSSDVYYNGCEVGEKGPLG